MKSVFDEGKITPKPLFSLSPIRKVEFELYQDLKYSLAGMITDQEFANMTKRYFMAILSFRMAKVMKTQLHNMVRVNSQDLNREDKVRCGSFISEPWLNHLGIANKTFVYNDMREEERKGAPVITQGLTFLDQINANAVQQNNSRSPLRNFGSASPATTSGPPPSAIHMGRSDYEGTSKYLASVNLKRFEISSRPKCATKQSHA